jgi:AcrR family transcriptional regulator
MAPSRRRKPTSNPTRDALLASAVELIEANSLEEVTIDMVLENSEVSRGSLYYHFTDFADLLEQALITEFSRSIDESILSLQTAIATSNSPDEFRAAMKRLTRATQTRDRADRRMERIVVFATSNSSEQFRAQLSAEQRRLTDAQTNLVRAAQDREWVRPELDAQAIAVLIQAYSLGRVVDDLDPEPVDEAAWIALIDHLTAAILPPTD